MIRLIYSIHDKPELIKKQILLVIGAVCVPLIANVIQLMGKSPFNMDLSPIAFGVCAMIIAYGISKFNLFKIIPVARSLVIKLMKAGVAVFDEKGNLLDINPAALRLLSLPEAPAVGTNIEEVFSNAPQLIRFFDSRRELSSELSFERNGVSYYCEASLTAIKNPSGKEIAWLFQLYDITERKLAEDIIEQAAYHDPLTGLPNRQYFQLMLSQEITLARMRGKKLAVAFLDLDNFKAINDGYGHEYGDALLKAVTKRLGGVLREADLIARLGGDEFAIIVPGVNEKTEIAAVGERLLGVFKDEFDLSDFKVSMRASIGFSFFPEDGDSNEALLSKADKAMYEVKKAGKNNYRTYKENA
jgi:diguanylate cyclase (GGDEF)-like protein/PAS domain S-box-containing protein